MRIRTILALLAFVPALFALPATAADPAQRNPTASQQPTALQPCPPGVKGMHVAQIDCCKGHKGVCGCRAGKIVCCDNTVSTEPGCTCRGDDGVLE